jgi:hypothetical protein
MFTTVKGLVEERGPGELNEATLLRVFAMRSVANPFEFNPGPWQAGDPRFAGGISCLFHPLNRRTSTTNCPVI